jgi:hypothetical protein
MKGVSLQICTLDTGKSYLPLTAAISCTTLTEGYSSRLPANRPITITSVFEPLQGQAFTKGIIIYIQIDIINHSLH